MDSECSPPSISLVKYCDCDCNCSSLVMKRSFSGTCLRSVKRKYDAFEEENLFSIPGLDVPQNARVEIGNECMALRETVSSQQQTIQNLIFELEEERNASSSAANEALSMILRLQRDKAEIQMEAKQFKRFAEEKMAHDQLETLTLEDLLYKREEVIEALTYELQAYKHRMVSYGLTEAEVDEFIGTSRKSMIENMESEYRHGMYPRLKCHSNESQAYSDDDDEILDIEKYAFKKMSHTGDQLKDLVGRSSRMENSPMAIQPDGELIGINSVLEKVLIDQSPRGAPGHIRKFSIDNPESHSAMGVETSEVKDDLGDRICTIDSVFPDASTNDIMDPKASVGIGVGGDGRMEMPGESINRSHVGDLEIQKLYARLHALEADRESMRHTIISIGTEKAQMVLLKEIAQNFSKEMSPTRRMPVRKQLLVRIFSLVSMFKWIIPLIFWRRKAYRCKFMFGLSSDNVGLLLLLDPNHHHVGEHNCVFNTDTLSETTLKFSSSSNEVYFQQFDEHRIFL